MFLLAIIIMVISQTIALLFDTLIPFYGIGTILSSITYILLTFFIVRWIITHVKRAIFISNYKTCISSDLFDFRDCITVRSICDLLYFIPGDFKIHHFNSISKTIHLSYIILCKLQLVLLSRKWCVEV